MEQRRACRLCLGLFALIGGCRELKDIAQPDPPMPASRPLELNERTAKFGMTGYQPSLRIGRTGNGEMGTAGLPSRGGGPTAFEQIPYGLAPDQRIGTPTPVGPIRVIVDPAWGTTAVYAR